MRCGPASTKLIESLRTIRKTREQSRPNLTVIREQKKPDSHRPPSVQLSSSAIVSPTFFWPTNSEPQTPCIVLSAAFCVWSLNQFFLRHVHVTAQSFRFSRHEGSCEFYDASVNG